MLRSDPVSCGAWGPLDKLEAQSIYIFRELFNKVDKVAMLWSFGKDSNVMIHLARKAFFGRVPFPLIHCETELEMDEVYQFRDRYAKPESTESDTDGQREDNGRGVREY